MAKLLLVGSVDQKVIDECVELANQHQLSFKKISTEAKQIDFASEEPPLNNILLINKNQLPAGSKRIKYIKSLDQIEAESIEEVVKATNGNISKAAKILGTGRATIYRKMKQFNIQLDSIRKDKSEEEEFVSRAS